MQNRGVGLSGKARSELEWGLIVLCYASKSFSVRCILKKKQWDRDSVLTNGIEFGYVNSKHRRDVSPLPVLRLRHLI